MSDVLVGAGIGMLVTKVVYLAYPAVKNLFHAKENKRGNNKLSLVPQLYPDHYGIYLQYRFN
jgi:hypothetical protein